MRGRGRISRIEAGKHRRWSIAWIDGLRRIESSGVENGAAEISKLKRVRVQPQRGRKRIRQIVGRGMDGAIDENSAIRVERGH